jgi:Protein of unknown function (DUF1592)/Protein of unknown function (DUF1588)/Protein of unknown function (DUF1595)/Protein of unknown function (DUF1585)/Protein of unknown function (DUF1587)
MKYGKMAKKLASKLVFGATRRVFTAALIVPLWACSGGKSDGVGDNQGGSGGDGSGLVPGIRVPDGTCADGDAAPFQLRRLTRAQLDNSVRDLLHVTSLASTGLAADEKVGPFSSNINTPVDAFLVEKFEQNAERLAAETNVKVLANCGTRTGIACGTAFVSEFGRRAFRRPLDTEETELFLSLFKSRMTDEDGIRFVIRAMLQSPNFLYHAEFGQGGERLTEYEIAARLSFMLWNTTPDDALLDLAGKGGLATPAAIRTALDGMLNDPRARTGLRGFHTQWLGLDEIASLSKSPVVFPGYTPALNTAMLDDVHRYVDHAFFDGDAHLKTLLTASIGFPSSELAKVYGVKASADVNAPVAMDPSQRAGLLTLPAFMATHAHADQGSPVKRGVAIRQRLLCQDLPSPPDNVNNAVPMPSPDATTRERFAIHEEDPACASCHLLIDPIGLGFENYDALGGYRMNENGKPIDASGELTEAGDVDGTFVGAVELSQKLAGSEVVAECMVRQWVEYSLGRRTGEGDDCLVKDTARAFLAADGDLRVLLGNLVTTPAFYQMSYGTMKGGQP